MENSHRLQIKPSSVSVHTDHSFTSLLLCSSYPNPGKLAVCMYKILSTSFFDACASRVYEEVKLCLCFSTFMASDKHNMQANI